MACLLVLALGLGVAACGSSGPDPAAAARAHAAAVAKASRLAVGRRVFAAHCQSCHTIGDTHFTRPIIEFEAPNLDEVRLVRHYVAHRVELGGPAMASFSGELTRARFDAVVEYVTATAGRNVVDEGKQPAAVLAAGRQVFADHCASCHAIAGRAMTGRPGYDGMDFTLVKPSERYVLQRLRTGVLPEEPFMPSFAHTLTDAQRQAVATYVTAVAKEGPEAPDG